MKRLAIIGIMLLTSPSWGAFSFYRQITVNHLLVPSTQSNFAVLVSTKISSLATAGNGGNIQNANGYDIGFFTSNDCVTGKMNWETELYTALDGTVVYWINVTSLSSVSDTSFFLCYDNGSISTDQSSSTSTWDANYLAVYHLGNGTVLISTDSTSNHYDLTNNGSWGAAVGQIDGATAKSVPASTQYFSNASIATPSSVTVSYWNKVLTGDTQTDAIFSFGAGSCENASPRLLSHSPYTDNNLYWDYGDATNGLGRIVSDYTSYLDNWAYVVLDYNNSNGLHEIYINGAGLNSNTNSEANPSCTGLYINRLSTLYGKRQLDEFRISNISRSGNWTATEYNNQFSPNTFESIGSEMAINGTTATSSTMQLMGI